MCLKKKVQLCFLFSESLQDLWTSSIRHNCVRPQFKELSTFVFGKLFVPFKLLFLILSKISFQRKKMFHHCSFPEKICAKSKPLSFWIFVLVLKFSSFRSIWWESFCYLCSFNTLDFPFFESLWSTIFLCLIFVAFDNWPFDKFCVIIVPHLNFVLGKSWSYLFFFQHRTLQITFCSVS